MPKIAGLDYVELKFDKTGRRLDPGNPFFPAGIGDLIIVSHGWHMDAAESQLLYETLIGNLVTLSRDRWDASGRKVGVCGVFWPSDKFRDDLSQETFNTLSGQAASAGGDLNEQVLKVQAKSIADFLGITDPKFEQMVLRAKGGGGDADRLVDVLRAAVGPASATDAQTQRDHNELMTMAGRDIVRDLKHQATPSFGGGAVPQGSAAASLSAGGGSGAGTAGQALGLFSGAVAAVAKLLNQFAYFELKKRSGTIGSSLGRQLDAVPGLGNVKVHLVGHSFGARLVTSAAAAMVARKVQSLTLLQGAFSHNSFSAGISYPSVPKFAGTFREVIDGKKVVGPVAVTHTWNDTAVGLAYPTASRIAQTIASAFGVSDGFGGRGDVYGGLGANGALGLDGESSDKTYDGHSELILQSGHVNNLRCDFIGNHNDVGRMEVARVLQSSIG